MILPATNATKSFWIEGAKSDLKDHRTTTDLPTEADVVIVGSGYTGASAAYWLHKMSPEGKTPSMVMLESRDICGGATGRNGGLLRPHAYSRYTIWSERFGPQVARDLIAFEMSHIPAFEEFMKEEGLAEETCYRMGETWDAAMTDEAWVRLKKAYADMERDHGKDDSIVSQCRVIEDPAEAESITQMIGAIGAIVHPSGQIWAYKFVHALLRLVMATGNLNVQSFTPCTGVEPVDADGWIVVNTDRGKIKARKVLHATNRWAGQLLPEHYQRLIFTGRGTLAAIKAPEGVLKHSGGQQWDHIVNNYLHQLPPPYNHIILGGAKPHTIHNPRDYLGNDDETTQMKGVPEYYHAWPKDLFLGWEGAKSAEFALPDDEGGVWTGLYSISIDGFPFIGAVPDLEGQFISAGYSGHGMPRIMGSTASLVPSILKSLGIDPVSSSIAEKFAPLPEPYKVTTERLEALKDADPRASVDADVEDNAKSAKKLWAKKPESLTMMEKLLGALNLGGSGITA